MKLFCFPYAGGLSTLTYSRWTKLLDKQIKVIPVELPGREKEISVGSFSSLMEAVDKLKDKLERDLDGDYAFWGHSMGVIVVYELVKKIQETNLNLPKHIFLSGKKPLHLTETREAVHTFSDHEFIDYVYSLNGTKTDILRDTQLRDVFLPILRKDFEIIYHYEHKHDEKSINVPTTIMFGSEEDISDYEKIRWNELICNDCKIYTLPGNHFFIDNNDKEITSIIERTIL